MVAQAVKRDILQGVRRDLTYHIASMRSLSSSSIMSIRSDDIEEGSILVHLAVLREEVTVSKILNPSQGPTDINYIAGEDMNHFYAARPKKRLRTRTMIGAGRAAHTSSAMNPAFDGSRSS